MDEILDKIKAHGFTLKTSDDFRIAFGCAELFKLKSSFPSPGTSLHVLSNGNIDFQSYLQYIILCKKHVKSAFMSCWSICLRDLLLLYQWHERGFVGQIDLFLGDFFPKKSPKEWFFALELQKKGVLRHVFSAHIHSKILLCETGAGEKIVVETSANSNMNPRVEQSIITQDEGLFNFYSAYFKIFHEDYIVAQANKAISHKIKEWLAEN